METSNGILKKKLFGCYGLVNLFIYLLEHPVSGWMSVLF